MWSCFFLQGIFQPLHLKIKQILFYQFTLTKLVRIKPALVLDYFDHFHIWKETCLAEISGKQ